VRIHLYVCVCVCVCVRERVYDRWLCHSGLCHSAWNKKHLIKIHKKRARIIKHMCWNVSVNVYASALVSLPTRCLCTDYILHSQSNNMPVHKRQDCRRIGNGTSVACLPLSDHCPAVHFTPLERYVAPQRTRWRSLGKCELWNLAWPHSRRELDVKTVEEHRKRRVFHVNVYISAMAWWIVLKICRLVEKLFSNNNPEDFTKIPIYSKVINC
jgi:hypothetical protein